MGVLIPFRVPLNFEKILATRILLAAFHGIRFFS